MIYRKNKRGKRAKNALCQPREGLGSLFLHIYLGDTKIIDDFGEKIYIYIGRISIDIYDSGQFPVNFRTVSSQFPSKYLISFGKNKRKQEQAELTLYFSDFCGILY